MGEDRPTTPTPTDRPRSDTGQYVVETSTAAVLDALDCGDRSTGEVAEAVGCSPTTARRRLKQLRVSGHVDSRVVGGSLLWTRIDRS